MRTMHTPLTAIGLVLILLGGLRGGETTSGILILMAFLILGVATYPPAEARRGDQAALILASAVGLMALGLVVGEARGGMVGGEALDDFLVLTGSALVMMELAARLLGDREERSAAGGAVHADGARPAPPPAPGWFGDSLVSAGPAGKGAP